MNGGWLRKTNAATPVHPPSHPVTQPRNASPQVCHTDLNENNLVVDDDRTRIVGVLDWGDITYCWRVVEIGVAVAYAMLMAVAPEPAEAAEAAEGAGPLAVGRNVLVRPGLLSSIPSPGCSNQRLLSLRACSRASPTSTPNQNTKTGGLPRSRRPTLTSRTHAAAGARRSEDRAELDQWRIRCSAGTRKQQLPAADAAAGLVCAGAVAVAQRRGGGGGAAASCGSGAAIGNKDCCRCWVVVLDL